MLGIAGKSPAQPRETMRLIVASGNFRRTAEIAGVVRIKSPIRFSWMSRMFMEESIKGLSLADFM
jgi:hypothetical protein